MQRSFKTISGLAASSVSLLVLSFAMIGVKGFTGLVQVWLGFAQGIPTNYVELMMNWRMLGLHFSHLTGPSIGWIVTGAGMLGTILIVLNFWRQPIRTTSPKYPIAIMGTFAATAVVAWHSHIPTAMFLLPPLVFLEGQELLPKNTMEYWVFLPASAYILAVLLASFTQLHAPGKDIAAGVNEFLNFIRGGSEFGLNLFLLIWAAKQIGARNLSLNQS